MPVPVLSLHFPALIVCVCSCCRTVAKAVTSAYGPGGRIEQEGLYVTRSAGPEPYELKDESSWVGNLDGYAAALMLTRLEDGSLPTELLGSGERQVLPGAPAMIHSEL